MTPLLYWSVSATVSGKLFCCQNKEGKTETWGEVSVSITVAVSHGLTLHGSSQSATKGLGKSGSNELTNLGPCPSEGIGPGFEVQGFIRGAAGILWGGKAELKFPIYPEFKAPNFKASGSTNITGIELDGGVEGSLKVYGPIGEKYKVL